MTRFGVEAVDLLIQDYPAAHKHFGDFPSATHFAVVVSQPEYVVAVHDRHWVICEILPNMTGNVHWFCPDGCDIHILRGMITGLFDGGLTQIQGTPPTGKMKRYELAARTLNRALGAEKEGDLYVLTKQRFVKYNKNQASA